MTWKQRREAKYNRDRAATATEALARSWRLDPKKMQWATDHSGQEMVSDPKVKDEMVFTIFFLLIQAAITQTREQMDQAFADGEVDRRLTDDEVVYGSMRGLQALTHEQWLEWAEQFAPAMRAGVEKTKQQFGL